MNRLILTILAIAALSQTVQADHDLTLSEEFPVVGKEVTLMLSGGTDLGEVTLFVTYRPNSATEKTKMVGTFTAEGKHTWCPEEPGITSLTAKDGEGNVLTTLNVATRFPSTPILGIIVMLAAGILLFGGAGVSLARALEDPMAPSS